MMYTDVDCSLMREFIDDHSEIALLYALKQDKDDCAEHIEFLEEMHFMGKFLMYSHMRANLNN